MVFRVLLTIAILIAPTGGAFAAGQLYNVTIHLKWLHQFQFAGYYAAIEQGYFAAEGLSATLIEGDPKTDPVEAVVDGSADFGVGNAELALDRMNGVPVVAVAAIYQHSPFIIIAKPSIRSIHDLAGKRLMLEGGSSELLAYLSSEGLAPSSFKVFPHTGTIEPFVDGKVDAMTAYVTTEPHQLDMAKVAYRVLDPKTSGIDFYGDTLFTSEALARSNPELVRKVRSAVVKGWKYALDHQDRMIDLILAKYSTRVSRDQLTYEADMIRKLAIPEVIEIGYMNPGRWQYIADTYARLGLSGGPFDVDAFLFDAHKPADSTRFYAGLGTLSVVALVVLAIAGRLRALNGRLTAEIERRARLEDTLRQQADTDFLTGLPNRRRLYDVGGRELMKAQRFNMPLSALMIDIDHFKFINDTYGHTVGDMVIRRVGEICASQLRDVDSIARMGGEEFAAVLVHATSDQAMEVAERIRNAVKSSPLSAEGFPDFHVTCSIGVAADHITDDLQGFLARADRALYQAKGSGRDCVRKAVS